MSSETDKIDTLRKSLEIYSPSCSENELAEFLSDVLRKNDFSPEIDEVGNVICKTNEKPKLLFCGHMDTVTGKLPVNQEGDFITGRGSVDAKSPLISMLIAFLELKDYPVMFAGVVEEERNSRGMIHLIKNLDCEYAIFGEPSNLRNIIIGYKGSLCVVLEREAEPKHLGSPHTNASQQLIDEFKEITKRAEPYKKKSAQHSLDIDIARMEGNQRKASVVLSIRIPYNMKCEDVINILDIKGRILEATEPFESDKKSPVISALAESVKEITGNYRLIKKTGSGDMNILGQRIKDVVTYGPGDSRLDHTDEEKIDVNDFLKAVEVYKKTAEKLLTNDKGGN